MRTPAEKCHRAHGRDVEAACAVHYRARTHTVLGQSVDAALLCAIRLCHTLSDHRTAGLAHLERAPAALDHAERERAAAHAATALHLLAEAHDDLDAALAQHCCGRALLAAGAPREALPHLTEAPAGLRRAADTEHTEAVVEDLAACGQGLDD